VDAVGTVFVVQAVLFDVPDDGLGHEVADAHVATAEETDLGGRNVVLHQLLNDVDVVFPLLELRQSLVDVGAGTLWYMSDDVFCTT